MTIAPTADSTANAARLPAPIRRALGRVDRRLKLDAALRGAGMVLVVGTLIASASMAADFIRPLPEAARSAIRAAWIALGAALLIGSVLRPILRGHPNVALASVAERGRPGSDGLLASAVEFVEAGEGAIGARELVVALIESASEAARTVDPARAVPLASARQRAALGLVAASVVALPAMLGVEPLNTLGRRFLHPSAHGPTAGLVRLDVRPGDVVLPRGGSLRVTLRARSRLGPAPDSAAIAWIDERGQSHRRALIPDRAGPLAVTLHDVDGPLSYRVEAGPSRTRDYTVDVVDPPRVEVVAITVTPPPYSGKPPARVDPSGPLVALRDSRVAIVAETDQPSRRVEVRWPVEPVAGAIGSKARTVSMERIGDGPSWSAEVPASASGTFEIIAEDARGFAGRPGTARRLNVVPDLTPVVALEDQRARSGPLAPGDFLRLPLAARDDLAVAVAELHVAVNRLDGRPPEEVIRPIDLEGFGTTIARGVAEFDLATLVLNDGDTLGVRVRVLDNLPPPRGPNIGWSAAASFPIAADAHRQRAEGVEAALSPIREALSDLARRASEDRGRAASIRDLADASRDDPQAWTEADRAEIHRLREAALDRAARLRELARGLSDGPLAPMAEPLLDLADASAEAPLTIAAEANDPDARLDALGDAEAAIDAEVRRLDALRASLGDRAEAALARPELADLSRIEDTLADRASALADAADPESGGAPESGETAADRLRDDQQALADTLGDLVGRAPGLRDDTEAAIEAVEEALDALGPAGSPDAARGAAEAMRRAADGLRRAAGAADPIARADRLAQRLDGRLPADSGMPTGGSSDRVAAGPSTPVDGPGLRDEHAWGGLPGHLRTELLRSSDARPRDAYARFIELYFRDLARAAPPEAPGAVPRPPR